MKLQKIVLKIVFLVFLLFSCSFKSDEQAFLEELSNIDTHISEGRSSKALKSLKRLQKKAVNSTNYVSIVKRQLKLGAEPDALICLQKGIKNHPESAELPGPINFYPYRFRKIRRCPALL
ncbi:hypothetical protein [Treponema sp. OMZ 799]|uniref:hypothetical protein n=1 Tax=Treponema sp. OMZ 799 TaxID=2563668 RepID=UPI0020A5977C|nr:hypothetical protein [Treponema sp. OMZ 799]